MAFLTRGRRRGAAAVCAAASLLVCARATAQTPENEVRAAFLYNFTKFVEWPQVPAHVGEPFRMCIASEDDFALVVEAIVKGESVGGRPIAVETPATSEAARACQVLFVSHGERERGARMLAAVRDLPVLTVGDSPRFLQSGGAIQFVLENRRVRFDINLPAIDRAGLRVSSDLLRVARTIQTVGAGQ